jgi:DNA-binding NarL/FixJ family response regulator
MSPVAHTETIVVIAEPHRAIADAVQDVVTLAGCVPVIVDTVEAVRAFHSPPAAMVVRIATEMPLMSPHRGLEHLARAERPVIIALTSSEADVAEAERLACDVIARAPHQVQALYETLRQLVAPGPKAGGPDPSTWSQPTAAA